MPASAKDFKNLKVSAGNTVKEIVCSQLKDDKKGFPLFAVFQCQDGAFIAAWENHHCECATEEELLAVLNQHEKTLYQFRAKN